MPPGSEVYLHYVLHRRVRLTIALGTPTGPCGTLNVKRRYFPLHRPAAGTWSLQFDQRKSYSQRDPACHSRPGPAVPLVIRRSVDAALTRIEGRPLR